MKRAVRVKVCGIRSAEVAKHAESQGADYVGVIHFEKSPRHVPLEQMKQVIKELTAAKSVAVMVAPNLDFLEEVKALGFDRFQIHFKLEEVPKVEIWSKTVGKSRLWLVPKVKPDEEFPESILEFADGVLIDTYSADAYGGTGKTGDWERFKELKNRFPEKQFILSGGLNPSNICTAIAESGADFVDLSSGVESSPGVKNLGLISDLFKQSCLSKS